MTKIYAGLLASLLMGCADTAMYDCCVQTTASGDKDGVYIFPTRWESRARSMAEKHCKEHGRMAIFNEEKSDALHVNKGLLKPTMGYILDCIK